MYPQGCANGLASAPICATATGTATATAAATAMVVVPVVAGEAAVPVVFAVALAVAVAGVAVAVAVAVGKCAFGCCRCSCGCGCGCGGGGGCGRFPRVCGLVHEYDRRHTGTHVAHLRLPRGERGWFSSVLIALLRYSCFALVSFDESMVLPNSSKVLLSRTIDLRCEIVDSLIGFAKLANTNKTCNT